jgi:hypothetical protein
MSLSPEQAISRLIDRAPTWRTKLERGTMTGQDHVDMAGLLLDADAATEGDAGGSFIVRLIAATLSVPPREAVGA